MVCHFDGQQVILDWKTATKPKKAEYLERYPLQLAAYCGAINRMYDTRIKNGVIVVALPNAEAQVFQFSLADYWQPWLSRLVGYWEQQTTPLAEQALGMIQSEYRVGIRHP
jgi:genome maintenance exonuclease 1